MNLFDVDGELRNALMLSNINFSMVSLCSGTFL